MLKKSTRAKPRKFPSKAQMKEAKIYNSFCIACLSPDKLFISFTAQLMMGRAYHPASYKVYMAGSVCFPTLYWKNGGHKEFPALITTTKPEALAVAIKWAEEQFGKREWVRDPFGSYQDARVVEIVWEEVKKGGKDGEDSEEATD